MGNQDSSSVDPSGSADSSGWKASGSSGSFMNNLAWLCLAALLCGCLGATASFGAIDACLNCVHSRPILQLCRTRYDRVCPANNLLCAALGFGTYLCCQHSLRTSRRDLSKLV